MAVTGSAAMAQSGRKTEASKIRLRMELRVVYPACPCAVERFTGEGKPLTCQQPSAMLLLYSNAYKYPSVLPAYTTPLTISGDEKNEPTVDCTSSEEVAASRHWLVKIIGWLNLRSAVSTQLRFCREASV